MDSSAQFPTLPPNPLTSVFSGPGGSAAPTGTPYEINPVLQDVVVSLSPEALAVLEGALEPSEALADAVRSGRDGSNPLLDVAGARGIFQIYGQVDVNRDGELDGPAGAAAVDSEDQPGLPSATNTAGAEAGPGDEDALTDDERKQVEELRSRDAEVRAHEFAHAAAGGGLTGAIRFSYQTGPDGKRYAIGGSVSIDTSPGSTPEETITKAQRIRAAAMAPADPSGQDRAVAAQAGAMESRARAQLARERADDIDAALSSAGAQVFAAASADPDTEGTPAPAPSAPTPAVALSAPSMGVTAVLHSDAAAPDTLADFSGGSVAQARLYSMPTPTSGLLQTPVEPQDLPAHLLR